MKYLKTLLIAVLVISLTACTEEEVAPDFEKLLISGKWTFSTVEGLDILTTTAANIFLTNSTLTFNEGGTVDSKFLFDSTNDWEFNADKTRIILDKGLASEDEWEIVSLTETEFIYRDNDDDDAGGEPIAFSLDDGLPLDLKFIH